MPNTKYNSKIVFYGETLMDLTEDTIDAASLLKGKTAHDKSGAPITGTCEYDSNTTDATATAAEILSGKTAYGGKQKITVLSYLILRLILLLIRFCVAVKIKVIILFGLIVLTIMAYSKSLI